MKLNDLEVIREALQKISLATECKESDIVFSLIGICWDEEKAGDILGRIE